MLKFSVALLTFATLALSANTYTAPFALPENTTPTPQSLLLDQVDTTDAYAIPFDSSEVEDEIQIDKMYSTQKKLEAEKKDALIK